MTALRVFIGFDPRELDGYIVTAHSLRKHSTIPLEVEPMVLEHLRWKRLYTRPHDVRDGRIWDLISEAPMATEFALTRFLAPHLTKYRGWALFCDCDFLFRRDVQELEPYMDPTKAVVCVKHDHKPTESRKMDGQIQLGYPRKNWSSFVLWNCEHEAHAGTLDRVNRWRGLHLHQFRWLQDEDIGTLPAAWNWLEGEEHHSTMAPPAAVHFTRGIPSMPGYEDSAYADEWRAALAEATRGLGAAVDRRAYA